MNPVYDNSLDHYHLDNRRQKTSHLDEGSDRIQERKLTIKFLCNIFVQLLFLQII